MTGPGNTGQRVELNAMTSDQFVAFVERKLTEHGAAKVIPIVGNAGRDLHGVQARRDGEGGAGGRTGAPQRRAGRRPRRSRPEGAGLSRRQSQGDVGRGGRAIMEASGKE